MARSMFEKYGGFAAIGKMVLAFYDKVLESEVIGDYFENVDTRKLIDHQTKFIASIMGGPASYSNEMLDRLHAHLDIGDAAFAEMVDLLRQTLEEFEFEPEDVAAIMGEIRARKPYIVSGPS